MSQRIGMANLKTLATRINIALNRPTAYMQDGEWTSGHLHVEETGGGYNFVESSGSATKRVLFYSRTKSELYDSMHAMITGIEYAEKAGYYSNTETDKRNAEYGVHA